MAVAALLSVSCVGVQAQDLPATASQQAASAPKAAAQSGVKLADLAPNAPEHYTVKPGDTLWGISGMYLKSPWRWPELWGMNREDIRNPHRIYPGQQLTLDKVNGRAILRTRGAQGSRSALPTVRVSPHTRSASLADSALPTLPTEIIEAFLAEPLIVNEAEFSLAPRIVAAQEGRVLLSRGDRAYASGAYVGGAHSGDVRPSSTYSSKRYPSDTPAAEVPVEGRTGKQLSGEKGEPFDFRVFRNAKPLKDPTTGAILGYEAQYIGQAELVRGESLAQVQGKDGKLHAEKVPATIDIVKTKEEMRVGDRLIPEPPRELRNYVPHAPALPMSGQIVSIYGSAVALAGVNQVVAINRGINDGLENGNVMAILKDGQRLQDRTDSAWPQIKLPDEHNGLLMVFRTFENLSYALILQASSDGVKVGDRFTNPN